MRHTHILAAVALLALASPASAQQISPSRPQAEAPASTAPFEQRAAWCAEYAAWYVANTPMQGARPEDARPSQLLEVEINYCELDPQVYERQIMAELETGTRET